jgi:glyoxylase-like metal-dependent hydrolase (beta-lactamase superfamily II)
VNQKLLPQLANLGYRATDITYIAMSHYHGDHSANANEFSTSTWIVQEPERAAMFTEPPPRMAPFAQYSRLKDAKTIVVKSTDHDVFGDGTVVLKYAPGHTPGHQMLFLKLARTGPVLCITIRKSGRSTVYPPLIPTAIRPARRAGKRRNS